MEYVDALNPLDGRYRNKVEELYQYFSEKAYFTYRARLEIRYLISFIETTRVVALPENTKNNLHTIADISTSDYQKIKEIEQTTKHDVKALEYFIKQKIKTKNILPYVHFGLTSEDVNNIAYALMVSDALENVILPYLSQLNNSLSNLGDTYRKTPILARTHGQPASPTTFGKEFRVYQHRVNKKIQKIKKHALEVKLNGATGNYSALSISFPEIDWVEFSKKFIHSFNSEREVAIQPNLITTQIEPHDSLVELCDFLKQTNSILIDLSQDIWRYISEGWLVQKAVQGEIGSSTMPHKVNPVDFENCEGNLGIANALLAFFAQKLPVSRLQRDLSDSTVLRNIGISFGYSLLAYKSLLIGLAKISVNKALCLTRLQSNPQIITEAIQIILKREGVPDAYEKLLEISRGRKITMDDLKIFINKLDIRSEIKEELLDISPENYLGLADKLSGSDHY